MPMDLIAATPAIAPDNVLTVGNALQVLLTNAAKKTSTTAVAVGVAANRLEMTALNVVADEVK